MSAAEHEVTSETATQRRQANQQAAIVRTLEDQANRCARTLIERLRALDPTAWDQANSDWQANTVAEIVTATREALVEGFRAMLEADHRVASGGVESVTFKDGDIKAVLKLPPKDASRHALADRTGTTVLMVMSDLGSYAEALSRLHDEYVDLQDQGELWESEEAEAEDEPDDRAD